MNANEFDLDFDFEKEYGFDLPKDEPDDTVKEDFDLRAILESDFTEEADLFHAEYENDFDYGPDEFPLEEDAPVEDLSLDIDAEELPFEPIEEAEEPSMDQILSEDDIPVVNDLEYQEYTEAPASLTMA